MITVQDVFQQFFASFKQNHSLSPQQAKVSWDIMNCRTAALGATASLCEECGHLAIHYNSCRNRHCTLCQGMKKEIWVDKRKKDILHAPYFHTVFTVPKELRPLVYQNQELLYNLMYKAVAQTLQELSQDDKYLGAQIGFFSLLHTWSQDLHYHPHIHAVVLAGGLTKNNKWHSSSAKFFIPVKVLSKIFRGKFLHSLKQYYRAKLLMLYGTAQQYEDPKLFQKLLNQCYNKKWYSYAKRTFSGPLAVIKYLGKYTHRIAIANTRIVAMNDDTVTFKVKDRKNNNQTKNITLSGVEFIRRFLMHVLPKGFVKIRHYGLLANRNKKTKLELCRELTSSPTYKTLFEGLCSAEILSIVIDKDINLCPECGKGQLKPLYSLVIGDSP